MSKNLEIEIKSSLTENEYNQLLPIFRQSKIINQSNFYIDDERYTLCSLKSGLRIRIEEEKIELTLKVLSGDARLEINQEISANLIEKFKNCGVFPSGEVKDYLENLLKFSTSNLRIFGELNNTRYELKNGDNLFALDKSKYFGVTDYEIECESTSIDNARKALKTLLSNNGVEYKENHLNKVQRVIEMVRK